MRIGLDYWNVISDHPWYFRRLAAMELDAGNEVHVISAIGANRKGTVEADVQHLGVPFTKVHEVVFRHPRESPVLKTALAVQLGLEVFYDDREDVCATMTSAGILALRVTRPGRPASMLRPVDFSTDDNESELRRVPARPATEADEAEDH